LVWAAAAVLIVSSAWLGVTVIERIPEPSTAADPSTPTPAASLPTSDVPGNDVADLGRFPGAVRTAYTRERQGSTRVIVLEYVAEAKVDDVRSFYRRAFRENGWDLVELDVTDGEWVFLVERPGRAAVVEIEDDGASTLIQIEVEVPLASPTPVPTPTPAPPPPPDDDDDDADDGDDAGDDVGD
jgi:hypothetical protein